VPSPRQKVVADALVPLFKFVTGRFPVTPFARFTAPHAGLFDAPVFDKYCVAVVLLANEDKVLAALPNNKSPCATVANPVPPRVTESVPVHPIVIEAALTSAVAGLPPNVMVTFVSFDDVKAAGTTNWLVVASVPDVGNVTLVNAVIVKVDAKAPLVVKFPPNVIVLVALLTPVPPKVGDKTVPFQTPVVTVPNVVKDV
jgi:hypothetical protein